MTAHWNRWVSLLALITLVCAGILTPVSAQAVQTVPTTTAALVPGAPGTAFRYVQTFGVVGEPYPADVLHLYQPMGLFIDSADNLYVAEGQGHRVLGFNANGENIFSIGHAGVANFSEGYLYYPHKITKDSDANLWVITADGVKEFGLFGNQLLHFSGNESSPFNDPIGIAFDHNGLLFVSDLRNHRIQIFSVSGTTLTYVNQIGVTGAPGSDDQHFNFPGMIAFDSENALYVADPNNYRIQKCTSADHWSTWTCAKFFGGAQGTDPSQGQLSSFTWSVTIDSADNVFIADGNNFRVLKCSLAGVCTHFVGTVGVQGSDNTHFGWLTDVVVDSTGKVYVADFTNQRVQVYTAAGNYVKTIGVTGVPYAVDNVRYNYPWGIATASNGGFYVYESNGRRLIKVNPDGSQAWTAGKAGVDGSGNDTFGPTGLWGDNGNPAESQDGKVYVPDNGNNRIQIFNADTGAYLSTYGQTGGGNNQFNSPTGVAINPVNQDILVVDEWNSRVQIYTSAWVYKATIGVTNVPGADNSHLSRPRGAAVDGSGAVFVADSGNYRVQKCTTANGTTYTCSTLVNSSGETGVGFEYIHPMSVAVDKSGKVYVVSDLRTTVQVYDANGAFLTSLGGSCGSGSGGLCYPQGVAVDKNGNIYVTDVFNQRVQKFAPGVPGWRQANLNGFFDANNAQINTLETFGDYLYAGTGNWSGSGSMVMRSADGTTWEPASAVNFGSADRIPAVIDMIAFGGWLYAATGWGDAQTSAQLWRTQDGATWLPVETRGFGIANAVGIGPFVISAVGGKSYLYAGVSNRTTGVSIFRSDSGEPDSWAAVAADGLGVPTVEGIDGFTEWNGQLFAAAEDKTLGGRVWVTANGSDWSPLGPAGLGDSHNTELGAPATFNGHVYVPARNTLTGAQIFRLDGGATWTPVMPNGFGNLNNIKIDGLFVRGGKLYAVVDNSVDGMGLMVSDDAASWKPLIPPGFGTSNNGASLWNVDSADFKGALYVGTVNSNNGGGGQIWEYLEKTTFIPVIKR